MAAPWQPLDASGAYDLTLRSPQRRVARHVTRKRIGFCSVQQKAVRPGWSSGFLAAKAGDFITITVNDNQLPVLKMLLMPVFVLASSLIKEVGTEITHSDLVKRHATRACVL